MEIQNTNIWDEPWKMAKKSLENGQVFIVQDRESSWAAAEELRSGSDDENATKKPGVPKFSESNVAFVSGGPRITRTFQEGCERLAGQMQSSKKDRADFNWIKRLLVFLSKVFGKPGFQALKNTVSLLRRGDPGAQGNLQITSTSSSVETQIETFVQTVQFAVRMNTAFSSKEFALCSCSIAVAKAWSEIKQSIDNNDAGWVSILENDSDIKVLREQSKKRNNLALSFGWLTLRAHPELKDDSGSINTEAFKAQRDRLQNDIAAGEHLMIIEELLGGSVFLLFVKGWKRIFRNGRYDKTREIFQSLLQAHCPNLPEQIRSLDPISERLLGSTPTTLPTFSFELEGAFEKKKPSLETLLTTTNEVARLEDFGSSDSGDESGGSEDQVE
ncbi:hypothetical protein HDK64DRAFT_306492 [Phyllosticta capitalensis]